MQRSRGHSDNLLNQRWGGVLVVVIGLLVAGCGEVSATSWRLVGVDGATLTLEVELPGAASSCNRLLAPEIVEAADTVEVTVPIRRRAFASTCTDDLQISQMTVELDAPLQDRALVGCGDDACDVVGEPLITPAP